MSDSEMKLNGVSQDEKRRWTDAEVRYLSAHRADGSHLIAHVLKRTPLSVRVKAARLHISLDRKPMKVCPICGTYFVRDNKAGRYGMCQVCWERRKADANAIMTQSLTPEVLEQRYIDALKSIGKNGNLVVVPEGSQPIVGK